MLIVAICGFLIGVVNCWNYFILKENKTIGGALLNPTPAYISGTFRNFGILLFFLYLLATYEFPTAAVLFVTIAVGYFFGGYLWEALYPIARIIGILSIIPTLICMFFILF